MGNTYFITGINGFLGRTIAKQLLKEGNEVAGLRLPGDKDSFSKINLCQFGACHTRVQRRHFDKRNRSFLGSTGTWGVWKEQGGGGCLCVTGDEKGACGGHGTSVRDYRTGRYR